MKIRSIFLWIVTLVVMFILTFIELINSSANGLTMTILTLVACTVFIVSFVRSESAAETIHVTIDADVVKERKHARNLESKRNFRKSTSHRMYHRN